MSLTTPSSGRLTILSGNRALAWRTVTENLCHSPLLSENFGRQYSQRTHIKKKKILSKSLLLLQGQPAYHQMFRSCFSCVLLQHSPFNWPRTSHDYPFLSNNFVGTRRAVLVPFHVCSVSNFFRSVLDVHLNCHQAVFPCNSVRSHQLLFEFLSCTFVPRLPSRPRLF